MRIIYCITASLLVFTSCQNKTDDGKTLSGQYKQKKKLLAGADSADVKYMAAMVDAAFQQTSCSYPGATENAAWNPPLLHWEQLAKADNSFSLFYNELTALNKQHECFRSGSCKLVDENNPHILTYTAKDANEELLVILNFDEDNRALNAQYRFMEMPLLLSNYDNGAMPVLTSSLLLRPYEVRVYQVH